MKVRRVDSRASQSLTHGLPLARPVEPVKGHAMQAIRLFNARTHFAQLIEQIASGAEQEIIIAPPRRTGGASGHHPWRRDRPQDRGRGRRIHRPRRHRRDDESGYLLLPVSAVDADPFDRLLAAHSLGEPLRRSTPDRTVAEYDGGVMLI